MIRVPGCGLLQPGTPFKNSTDMLNLLAPQLHVLVADQNESDRLFVSRILIEAGCRVTETDNGPQAADLYEQLHPDLVWLDAYLPQLNGLQICEQIGSNAEQHQVPVLMGVSLADPTTIDRAFEMGASNCLPKPLNPTTTFKRLQRILQSLQVEKAVQRAKREWEATFDVVSDLILLTDCQGNIVRCNQAAIRSFKTTYVAVLGASLAGLFYGTVVPQPDVFSADSITAQFPQLRGWYQVSNYPVQPDAADGRLGYVHILRDITLERQMADELYASQQRFQALVENTSEGIQLIDATGKLLYASPHIAQMLGYEFDFVGENAFKHIHPEDLAPNLQSFGQFLQHPESSIVAELRVQHKDGRWIWLHITSRNLLNLSGVDAVLVNVRDITERKQAEEQLRASEARYRTLFEDSPVALWEEDFSAVKAYLDQLQSTETIPDFRAYLESHPQVIIDCASLIKVIDVNKNAMRMLGAQKKDELSNSLASILALDGYKGFRSQLLAISEGRTYITVENVNRSTGDEPRFVSIIWSVWPGYEKTLSRVTVSVMDLTAWRQSEEALRVSRERYELAVQGSNDGIWDWNLVTNEVYISARYKGILGYGDDEFQPSLAIFLDLLHPEDTALVESAIQEYLDGRSPSYHPEYRVRHKDGSYRWVLSRGAALRDADGNPYRMAGSITDITERKGGEELLRDNEARYRTLFEDSPVALWEEDFSEVKVYLEHLRTAEHVTDFPAYFEEHPQAIVECVSRIKVLDVNKAAMTTLGAKTKDELKGGLSQVLASEGYQGFTQELVAIAKGSTSFTIEASNRTRDNDLRHVSVMWSAWPGYENTLSKVTVSIVDLTDRQRAEDGLRVVTQAIEQSSTAIIITDVNGNIEYVNSYFTQLTGYSPEEVQGHNPRLLKSGEASQKVYRQLWATITSGAEWRGEFHNKKKNGEFYWAQAAISPIVDAHGAITRFLAVQEDITERKQAEAQLRASEERFKLVTYATNDAVWELDLANRQRWWNVGVRSVFGYVPEQVGFDQTWWETLIHPDDRARVLASLESAISSDGQFWSKEYRYRKADGSYAYVFDRGYITQDEAGRPQRIIGAMMDITERKRTEDALRQSEETFSKAFHSSPLPMAIISVHQTIYTDINSGWEALFNLEREKTIGQVLLASKPHIKLESTDNLLKLLREQGSVRDFELVYQPDSQDEHILLVSAQTIDIHGKASYLITCYDITEQRRMHTAMAASQKLADLGTLAAGVAHEMNSPLQVITGVSQSLLRRLGTGSLQVDNLKRNLEVVHRNGWRCAEIVRSLHSYARASGGAPEPTDLNEVVRDTLLLIEHQLKSWANISVLTNFVPDLPLLTCDHNQITQVLINLLTNARDAMHQGGEIILGTRYDAQANHLLLCVQDSGIGIPESIRDRIFDPFFTTKALGKGTGLGLSIVAGIVRAHGGTIEIESAPYRGTLFTLRFPVQPVKLPPVENDTTHGRFDAPIEAAVTPQGVSQ